ncbi:MAG: hypothetical protein M1818_004027 [Claussenomyces sp. TS43310]|nr:MAG: hypothetical protein M1818_004027 [Claussenomyces sp. TS43310]
MNAQDESAQRSPMTSDNDPASSARTVPILQTPTIRTSAPSPVDPMDVTSPKIATMGPPARNSPEADANGAREHSMGDHGTLGSIGPNAAAAAQAGSQAPKVVQTAFIHKLYNSPESPLWEFKHGNGNFKRGDLVGLREIKRRASRHALVHRDSYPSVKPPSYTQPGTPSDFVQPIQEPTDTRLANLEQSLNDMHSRLVRSEENSQFLHVRNQIVIEALSRSLQLNHEMSRAILGIMPNPDSPIHRSIIDMQGEMQRQTEILRSFEDPSEAPFSGSRPYFSNLSLEQPPVSPRQLAQDDPRRPLGMPQTSRQPNYKPAVPAHLSITPRRYGSIGSTTASSPSSLRYQAPPPPPPPPHPLSSVQPPPSGLSRRHTSADIRAHGWQPTPSPFASEHSQWPPSPKRGIVNEDQRIRDSFSSYSLQAASQNHSNGSRPATPPFSNGGNTSVESLGIWSWGTGGRGDKFGGSGFGASGLLKDGSGPPTRRSSMAHILNPAETMERDDEHEDVREEDRKRKRL